MKKRKECSSAGSANKAQNGGVCGMSNIQTMQLSRLREPI